MAYARAVVCAAVLPFLFSAGARAQSVVSAHSGVIHYIEGDVTIDGAAVHPKFAEFPEVKSGQVLATAEGRAEMLLTPGVFLRLAENSSVRMHSNALADTRLEVVSGSALIEVGELLEHNAIAFDAGRTHLALSKKGLYRIDAGPNRLQVYEGQALVTAGQENLTARKGHQIDLDAASLADTRFDVKDTDPFYRWSARRAEYVAAANVASARVASNSEYYASGATNPNGAWSWNPYFGMYTFLPGSGVYWSPFGAAFYSPAIIPYVFIPQRGVSLAGPGYAAPASLGATRAPAVSSVGAGGLGRAVPSGGMRGGAARGR
jgi:hypothetical protein